MTTWVTWFSIGVTVSAYALSRLVARHYPSAFTTPVFFSTILIIVALVSSGVQVADYEPAKQLMGCLLGPATVALAVPLYKNRRTLLSNSLPALAGLISGSVATLSAAMIVAACPTPSASRSVSSRSRRRLPSELAPIIHGNPTLAAAFVIATGVIGAMLGPWLMTAAGIHHPLARGLALGTISHGQGTAQAVIEGELQGAAAGIAMGLAAVFTSIIAPVLVPLLG
jgi:putative effector of murein hydrolase